MRLVLASASPRRRELLAALGASFTVRPANVDESADERDPVRLAEGLALRKARAIAGDSADEVVLGSDTVVALDGRLLAKPADAEEAATMLRDLRGREHRVATGVAVVAGKRVVADHSLTVVRMRDYGDDEIVAYVASGSPLDKAGAYAIQDDLRPVREYDGCECGVIGLPLWTTRRLLRVATGIQLSAPPYDRCRRCPLAEEPTTLHAP